MRLHRTTAALCCAGLLQAASALAQAGSGAERYEVTITPPKRPGTEEAAPASGDPAATPAANAASNADAETAPAPGDAAAPATAAKRMPSAPSPSAASDGPRRTLQVGAFRQLASAESLKSALAASFTDVAIVEVQSGGEPLFRVNVGRLPKGPALDELKRRLSAAGYASFDVQAPPVAAAH